MVTGSFISATPFIQSSDVFSSNLYADFTILKFPKPPFVPPAIRMPALKLIKMTMIFRNDILLKLYYYRYVNV